MMSEEKKKYQKPGDQGGRLIRRWVSLLRQQGLKLPISSDILIATSGGPDSVALAHLFVHFGRRIVPRNQIHLLHVNHHWRDEESNVDEGFVRSLGESWQVPVIFRHLDPPRLGEGESWEELARSGRKLIYQEESEKLGGALVFTGHQADDLAETLIWRFFTGALDSHGGGIYVRHASEVRPLLTTRKAELIHYLQEVNQEYCRDSTNESERFLRSRMRKVLMPEVERLFPKAVDHLVQSALEYQQQEDWKESQLSQMTQGMRGLQLTVLKKSGIKLRRAHWNQLKEGKDVSLPQGWRLTRKLK